MRQIRQLSIKGFGNSILKSDESKTHGESDLWAQAKILK